MSGIWTLCTVLGLVVPPLVILCYKIKELEKDLEDARAVASSAYEKAIDAHENVIVTSTAAVDAYTAAAAAYEAAECAQVASAKTCTAVGAYGAAAAATAAAANARILAQEQYKKAEDAEAANYNANVAKRDDDYYNYYDESDY